MNKVERGIVAGAKPVMLIQLQNLSMQDAHAAAFLHGSPVTKIVFALHQLLTTAFNAVVNALQVLLK